VNKIPEWLRKDAEFLCDAKDAEKWSECNQCQLDAVKMVCVHCGEVMNINRPEPPEGEKLHGAGYCPKCKIGYWFEFPQR